MTIQDKISENTAKIARLRRQIAVEAQLTAQRLQASRIAAELADPLATRLRAADAENRMLRQLKYENRVIILDGPKGKIEIPEEPYRYIYVGEIK